MKPCFKDSINFLRCFEPLEVIASGNSAILSFLLSVTFFTSIKNLSHKKSNLVSLEYLNSALLFLIDLNSSNNLFVNRITIRFFMDLSIIFYLTDHFEFIFNFLLGSSTFEIQTLFPLFNKPSIDPVLDSEQSVLYYLLQHQQNHIF